MAIISIFNNFGGTGKTTATHHIACAIAGLDRRVLLVDASPLCQLSSMYLGADAFTHLLADSPDITLHGVLSPVFSNNPGQLQVRDVISIHGYENVLLIPGSFKLVEYESALKSCVDVNADGRVTRPSNLPGSFYHLLLAYYSELAIDHIIIDMGPSLPSINQALLFSSDYFIVPLGCDSYANLSIRHLANTLVQWARFAECNRPVFEATDYPLKAENPIYIGSLIQKFNVWRNAPTQVNKKIIDSIGWEIANSFLPVLREFNMTGLLDSRFLIQIPDFNSLNALYHQYGLPIFDLTTAMMKEAGWQGAATRRNQSKILDFKRRYLSCAETIVAMGGQPCDDLGCVAKSSGRV